MSFTFYCGNTGKIAEVRAAFATAYSDAKLDVVSIPNAVELQSSLDEIVKNKGQQAATYHVSCNKPGIIFCEDTSLEIDDLGGFPGPYIKHFFDALGAKDMCLKFGGSHATLRSAIAVYEIENTNDRGLVSRLLTVVHDSARVKIVRVHEEETETTREANKAYACDYVLWSIENDDVEEHTFANLSVVERNMYTARGRCVVNHLIPYLRERHQQQQKLLEEITLPNTKRHVVLITDNEQKIQEYRRQFALHDVDVICRSADWVYVFGPKTIAILCETGRLYRDGTFETIQGDPKHMEVVQHYVELQCCTKTTSQTFRHAVHGYIDLTRRQRDNHDVFGWDDIFVHEETGMTFHEMAMTGQKVSGRDVVISQVFESVLYHRVNRPDLNFFTLRPQKTIDWNFDVYEDFVMKHRLLRDVSTRAPLTHSIIQTVCERGVFFRSAANRRQRVYWFPGLNSGIPLTAKKDIVHETTFMVHDFGHFIIDDLVFTGSIKNPLHRAVYVTYRMISEAITMVLADIVFVHGIRRTDDTFYDYSTRCIYPLVMDNPDLQAALDRHDTNVIRAMCEANVRYCLEGDLRPWRSLGASESALEKFTQKYERFFQEDYRWTINNYDNMAKDAEFFSKWTQLVFNRMGLVGIVDTVDSFTERHFKNSDDAADIVGRTFDAVWKERVLPAMMTTTRPTETDRKTRQQNAFRRYITGQLALCVKVQHLTPRATETMETIIAHMSTAVDGDDVDCERVNDFFVRFVSWLSMRSIIKRDDAETFKDMYPLFEPFYVFYDAKRSGNQKKLHEYHRELTEKTTETKMLLPSFSVASDDCFL